MAVTAPKTIAAYPLDNVVGAIYDIPFDYLARKFIKVTAMGNDGRKELIYLTDYKFGSKTTIVLVTPVVGDYDKLELRRFTSATDRLVDFYDGSILRAYDLNLSQIQTMHIAEEARDVAGDSIGVDDQGNLDSRGRKIVNLADGTEDTDVINLKQLKEQGDANGAFAERAEKAAKGAEASETHSVEIEKHLERVETHVVELEGSAHKWSQDSKASATTSVDAMNNAEDAAKIVVPLVPKVEKAAEDAAQAAADAEKALEDVKQLGAVPIGSIVSYLKDKPAIAGYLKCDGSKYSTTDYPDLFKYLGTNTLPNLDVDTQPIGSIIPWMSDSDIPEGWHHLGAQTVPEQTVPDNMRSYLHAEYPEFCDFLNKQQGLPIGGDAKLNMLRNGEAFRQVMKQNTNSAPRDITTPWEYQTDAIRNITGNCLIMQGDINSSLVPTNDFHGALKASRPVGTVGKIKMEGNVKSAAGIAFDASLQVPTARDNRMVNRSVNYLIKVKDSTSNSNTELYIKAAGKLNEEGLMQLDELKARFDVNTTKLATIDKWSKVVSTVRDVKAKQWTGLGLSLQALRDAAGGKTSATFIVGVVLENNATLYGYRGTLMVTSQAAVHSSEAFPMTLNYSAHALNGISIEWQTMNAGGFSDIQFKVSGALPKLTIEYRYKMLVN